MIRRGSLPKPDVARILTTERRTAQCRFARAFAMLQMLQSRRCHMADAYQATDDDQTTYVHTARVTRREGVTSLPALPPSLCISINRIAVRLIPLRVGV